MSNYDRLVEYLEASSHSLLTKAKTINAWIYSSKLPGGYGVLSTSPQHAADDETGTSCGWRTILFQSLMDEIGVQTRTVNFYGMPFQGNHTTLEVLINGKWTWFDPTFGTYMASGDPRKPISISEGRANGPETLIVKADTPGWTGSFQDLAGLSRSDTYKVYTDGMFFYQPREWAGSTDRVSAHIQSLYFGGDSKYWPSKEVIPGNGYTFKTVTDKADAYDWARHVRTYDGNELIAQWGEFDKGSPHYAWFKEWDAHNAFQWKTKVTYMVGWHLDYTSTQLDDATVEIFDYDQAKNLPWTSKFTVKFEGRQAEYQQVAYDDGRVSLDVWDLKNLHDWSRSSSVYDAGGNLLQVVRTLDTGVQVTVDLDAFARQDGGAAAEDLAGGDGSDFLRGLGGNDRLNGLAGGDRMEGGAGNDIYYADSRADEVIEFAASGTDEVRAYLNYVLGENVEHLWLLEGTYGTGNRLNNFIRGNDAANVLSGLGGNDTLHGQGGKDLLSGHYGRDVLWGGEGTDTLWGGYDADRFVFQGVQDSSKRSSTADLIRDFSRSQGDRIDLSKIDANASLAGNQSFKFLGEGPAKRPGSLTFRYDAGSNETLLFLYTTGDMEMIIRLSGKHALTAGDFFL